MEISEWKGHIVRKRKEKNQSFIAYSQSPIPLENRFKFEGLDHYHPDPDYRFELQLNEHQEKNIIKTEDTKGKERELIRWGEFIFKINGIDCKLQDYKSSSEEERFFIPFRDAASGKETYGAGRYLDLESEA